MKGGQTMVEKSCEIRQIISISHRKDLINNCLISLNLCLAIHLRETNLL
jgi:hypothetical protein